VTATLRTLLVAVALVGVGLAVDVIGGGKHPLTLLAVAIGGGIALVVLAVLVPGGLLARPAGSRPGELGWGDDLEAAPAATGEHTP
jgi:hypothetical protein